jgi:hypothetical protein
MNQHDYVKECLEFYEEGGFIPGAKWEAAHYPAPKGKGDTTIPMLHDHHQVQGLWQSKEYDQCCFYNGHAKRFLTEGPFVTGWFELWDIYDEYSGENARKTAELGVGAHAPGMSSKGGTKTAELGIGAHAPGMASKGGTKAAELGVGIHAPGVRSKGGTKAAELGVGAHAPGKASKGAKTNNSQKWMCLETGHISTPGGLSRWQKARGIDTALRRRIS